MPKLKVKHKKDRIIVTAILSPDEQKNERELSLFAQRDYPEFFRPKVISDKKILYFAPAGQTLREELRNHVKADFFFAMLGQVSSAMQRVEELQMSMKNLTLDMGAIYVNDVTREACMLYQPIISRETASSPMALINDMLYTTVFGANEDVKPVSDFIRFFRGLQNFAPAQILDFLTRVSPQTRIPQRQTAPNMVYTNSYGAYQRQSGQLNPLPGTGNEEGTTVLSGTGGTTVL